MSVYFLREGDLVKIGYSGDVRQRIATLIKGLHGNGEVLGVMPGDRSVEHHFHEMFAKDREYGEWFRVSERLLQAIAMVAPSREMPEKPEAQFKDRLALQEDKFAEEAAYFIREFLEGTRIDDTAFGILAKSTSIPADRLKGIYQGTICPITAGEYVLLRMMQDAALGITPDDMIAANAEAERWARQRHLELRRGGYVDVPVFADIVNSHNKATSSTPTTSATRPLEQESDR